MLLGLVSILAAALSVLVSWLALSIEKPIILIPDFLKLQLSENPGIAFSIRIPSPWQEFLIVSALAAVCIIAVRSKLDRLSSIAFGLIIGGAIGNLFDRIGDGLVTDYISVGTFPVFNMADSCITVGAALLILHGLCIRKT